MVSNGASTCMKKVPRVVRGLIPMLDFYVNFNNIPLSFVMKTIQKETDKLYIHVLVHLRTDEIPS